VFKEFEPGGVQPLPGSLAGLCAHVRVGFGSETLQGGKRDGRFGTRQRGDGGKALIPGVAAPLEE
jgi:hypothetical protein